MTETVRDFVAQEQADAEYRTDEVLPPAVRDLVSRGREVIRQAAEAAEAAEREKQAAAQSRARRWLEPVRAEVKRAVPAEIHCWVQYPVEEVVKLAAEFLDNLPHVKGANDLVVMLRAPGCREVRMVTRRGDMGDWHLVKGYEFQTCGEAFSDLPTALAVARDAFLRDLDIPL